MSGKPKNKKKAQDEELDLSAYSYAEGTKVELESGLFLLINRFINEQLNDETKVYFQAPESGEDEEFFNTPPIVFFTEKGRALSEIRSYLLNAHEENIKSGVAQLITELNKPKIKID